MAVKPGAHANAAPWPVSGAQHRPIMSHRRGAHILSRATSAIAHYGIVLGHGTASDAVIVVRIVHGIVAYSENQPYVLGSMARRPTLRDVWVALEMSLLYFQGQCVVTWHVLAGWRLKVTAPKMHLELSRTEPLRGHDRVPQPHVKFNRCSSCRGCLTIAQPQDRARQGPLPGPLRRPLKPPI